LKILFDTKIILDVMLLRRPFYEYSAFLLAEVERKRLEGFVCATTITTLHYLIEKSKGPKEALIQIEKILNLFKVIQVDQLCLESALRSPIKDYEDAVIEESASRARVDGIVTRNEQDFLQSKLNIYNPEELVKIIKS